MTTTSPTNVKHRAALETFYGTLRNSTFAVETSKAYLTDLHVGLVAARDVIEDLELDLMNARKAPETKTVDSGAIPQAWKCYCCGQNNVGWATECGRCTAARRKTPAPSVVQSEPDWTTLGKIALEGFESVFKVKGSCWCDISPDSQSAYIASAKAIVAALPPKESGIPTCATDAEFDAWWTGLEKWPTLGHGLAFIEVGPDRHCISKCATKATLRHYLNWKASQATASKRSLDSVSQALADCGNTRTETSGGVETNHPKTTGCETSDRAASIKAAVDLSPSRPATVRRAFSDRPGIVFMRFCGMEQEYSVGTAELFARDLDVAISQANGMTSADRRAAKREAARKTYEKGYEKGFQAALHI
jgi:hypothetical protein